jgi:DNA phosphorothioation-associated putative methyltransferase
MKLKVKASGRPASVPAPPPPESAPILNGLRTTKELLAPLMTFVTERGRLPTTTELPSVPDILAEFRTLRRAFQVILQATDQEEWDAIAEKRRQDLLVYLALTQFSHRPKFSNLDSTVQNDIKALFGNYKQACAAADLMLLSVGDPRLIANCCKRSYRQTPTQRPLHPRLGTRSPQSPTATLRRLRQPHHWSHGWRYPD